MKNLLFITLLILFSCSKEQTEPKAKEQIRYKIKLNSDEVFLTYSRNDTVIVPIWRVEGAGFMNFKTKSNDRVNLTAVCTFKTYFKVYENDSIIFYDTVQAGGKWKHEFYCK